MIQRSRIKWLFVGPGMLWVLAFTMFPLLYSLRLAFMRARLGQPQTFNGLANFKRAFTDYRFWDSLEVTILFVVASMVLTVSLGLGLALLFNRPMRGRRVFRSLFTMPMFAAPIAMGYLGLTIFHEQVGAVNTILRALGVVNLPPWFSNIWLARLAILFVDIWQWTPFCFLVLLAGLQSLPDDIFEAAALDSSSAWDTFRYVTLPLLGPVLFTVTMLRLVEAFKILDIPFSMTNGGPGAATQTLSFYIYLTGLRNFNAGYASALAYLLLAMVMIIAMYFFRRLRQIYE
ncbi:MAG TPA: sugar ABC transporter permease [Anaerolineae bacterium]|nr:sugar ABC transporter permease [Anaerolineae bacterium]